MSTLILLRFSSPVYSAWTATPVSSISSRRSQCSRRSVNSRFSRQHRDMSRNTRKDENGTHCQPSGDFSLFVPNLQILPFSPNSPLFKGPLLPSNLNRQPFGDFCHFRHPNLPFLPKLPFSPKSLLSKGPSLRSKRFRAVQEQTTRNESQGPRQKWCQ